MMRKFGLFVTFLVFGWTPGASALPANNPITAGLIAAYEFSGNADDVSGNGNDGVVNGPTLTADRFGNVGSAYEFDGVDDVIAMPTPILGYAEFTSSFWLEIDPSSSQDQSALQMGLGHILFLPSAEVLRLGIFADRNGGASSPSSSSIRYFYDTSIAGFQNSWIHVAFSVSANNTGRVFLNGTEVLGVPRITDPGLTGEYDLTRIGLSYDSRFNFEQYWFSGSIDDVYIYDRALSPTEVSTLYSAVPEPSTALLLSLGLVGLTASRRRV
jgi:hypothetical protein